MSDWALGYFCVSESVVVCVPVMGDIWVVEVSVWLVTVGCLSEVCFHWTSVVTHEESGWSLEVWVVYVVVTVAVLSDVAVRSRTVLSSPVEGCPVEVSVYADCGPCVRFDSVLVAPLASVGGSGNVDPADVSAVGSGVVLLRW